jgi:HNH endonuclease
MNAAFQEQVKRRAGGCCEPCRIPEAVVRLPFQIDHIIAEQHGGRTTLSNCANSCLPCNKFKGPNISGIDPKSKKLTLLFHPRRHKWHRHFRWPGPYLRGQTAIGRTTVVVLNINDAAHVAVRQTLIEEGCFHTNE